MMENVLRSLLPEAVICQLGEADAEAWHSDELTQGESHQHRFLERPAARAQAPAHVPVQAPAAPRAVTTYGALREASPDAHTQSFADFLASHIDDMFTMYSYDTKRDIRQYLRDRLISWVSEHAREFFGPSTSRAISACLRGQNLTMADVERFAEFVSFLLDSPIQAGAKTVVWHGTQGTEGTSRVPLCSLSIKSQGVFVTYKKI